MEKIIALLGSKQAKRAYWTIVGAILPIIAVELGKIDWYLAPLLIAAITGMTKEINNMYLKQGK